MRVARQGGLAGHLLRSAKFICMGKQKNRLTAIQPPNHIARTFSKWCARIEPAPASRTSHPSPALDVAGAGQARSNSGSRVGESEVQGRPGSSYPIPRPTFFVGSTELPYTSIDLPYTSRDDLPYTSPRNGPGRRRRDGRRGIPSAWAVPWAPPGASPGPHGQVGGKVPTW